ncbi:MAG: hypothetical protein JWN94_2031 [Betaproteobacteria bacterium]|nr:hypothetical protein [Betaproteobacteria bacterium]
MRTLKIICAAAFIAGCASQETGGPGSTSAPAPRPATPASPGINLTGYSPAFRAGYADGCNSVTDARKRDEARFKSEPDYAQGWRDGNDICRRRK